MRHEMLTQRALFCHRANTKRGTLSQHFVTHVVPPLCSDTFDRGQNEVKGSRSSQVFSQGDKMMIEGWSKGQERISTWTQMMPNSFYS